MQSMRPKRGWAVAAALALTIPAIAQSHTTISPRQSTHGATVKYTVRIPTEGDVATTGAELDVPEDDGQNDKCEGDWEAGEDPD